MAQGKLDEALKAYRDGLAIAERLAAADRSNTQWQRDLSVSYDKVGDVLVAQGKLDEALKAYRDGLAIASASPPPIAAIPSGSAICRSRTRRSATCWWRRASSTRRSRPTATASPSRSASPPPIRSNTRVAARSVGLLQQVGDVLVAQGKLDEALKAYRDSLAIRERLAAADRSNTRVAARSVGLVRQGRQRAGGAGQARRGAQGLPRRPRHHASASPPPIAATPQWQRDLSVSYDKVGDVLVAQGKLDEALKAYRDGLAIARAPRRRRSQQYQWQRDLSVSYDKVGDVLVAQGKLDEALKAYRDSLAIRERLAAADRSNTQWQRDLSVSYDERRRRAGGAGQARRGAQGLPRRPRHPRAPRRRRSQQYAVAARSVDLVQKVGNVLVAQGKLDEALKAYRDGLAIAERLAAADRSNTQWQRDLQFSIGRIGGIAYNFVLARNFVEALEAADQAISLAPEKIWLYTNRAHALMFLDRVDEARALYLKYRGAEEGARATSRGRRRFSKTSPSSGRRGSRIL